MFPFQRSGELSFQISNKEEDPQKNDIEIKHDLLESSLAFDSVNWSDRSFTTAQYNTSNKNPNNNNYRSKGGRQRLVASGRTGGGDDNYKRRVIHKETERQRRQEMASLHTSLRALLPVDNIKGKRSVSDHLMEATNYIKHLERKVKEMKERREKLMIRGSSFEDVIEPSRNGSSSGEDVIMTIERYSRGLEIKINSSFDHREEGFPLSGVLRIVLEEGLDVFSCVSTRVNQRWIHVIHTEVNDVLSSTDIFLLRQRLFDEICSK